MGYIMAGKRLKNLRRTTDTASGLILQEEVSYTVKSKAPLFIMIFTEMMSDLYKISNLTDIKVLLKLCELSEFGSPEVRLPPKLRKMAAEELQMSYNTFGNSITSLRSQGFISGSHGLYELNIKYFWKGHIDKRNDLIKNRKAIKPQEIDKGGEVTS